MTQKKKEAPPTLVLKRTIHAKRDRVFEAWTKPEAMQQWFYCGQGRAEVTNSLRVGGSYQNKMIMQDPCAQSSDGSGTQEHMHTGEYLEIIPPEKIVFTWNSKVVTNSRVTVELRDLGDSTELTLTHELLETAELRDMHSEGWEGCLANLVTHFQ